MIIGRIKEINILENTLISSKPELVALVGRRRVGKTYLVREVFKDNLIFEITGIRKGNKSEQLKNFSFALKYAGLTQDIIIFNDWLDAFFELTQLIEKLETAQKKVLFFDELPWMASKRSGFLKAFGFFWNSWANKKNITVIICGSAASWMVKKVINDRGGLHNRITKLIHLDPFTLKETEQFLQHKNINYPRYQILQLYMAMGGIPMYLEFIEKEFSPIENINKICFEKSGFLRREFDNLYAALFDNHENHIEIIKALASKRKGLTRKEIIEKISMSNGGTFTHVLDELIISDFVDAFNSYEKKTKETVFRLKDPYSLFYLSFIKDEANNTISDFNQIANTQSYISWSGYTFENICFNHLKQIKNALGITGVLTNAYAFSAKPKDGLPGIQIDLIIDRKDKTMHICEMKFSSSKYVVSKKEAERLRLKKTVFRYHTDYKHHIFTTLLTTYGVVENQNSIGLIDQVILMDALFE